MILLYVLSIIAICSAQEATGLVKLDNGNEAKAQKLQENIEALMRQVGGMGLLLENYRRVILSGITEASDVCEFIERLSDNGDVDNKTPNDHFINDNMGIRLYKSFFQKLDDPLLKSQLFSTFENHIDDCFAPPSQLVAKRQDKIQKVRFHSWGGKRARGAPKVVIRTPFHSWGGKRSGKNV